MATERLTGIVSARISDFKRKMAEVRTMTTRFTSREAEKQIDANTTPFKQKMIEARTSIAKFNRESTVDVDGNNKPLERVLNESRAKIANFNRRTEKEIGADTSELHRKLTAAKIAIKSMPKRALVEINARTDDFERRIDDLAKSIRSFQTVGGNMFKGGLWSMLPTISPMLAGLAATIGMLGNSVGVAAGGLMGMASSLVAAASGAGMLAPFLITIGNDLANVYKNVERGSAEWRNLSQSTRNAVTALDKFVATYQNIESKIKGTVMQGFANYINAAETAMGMAEPAIVGMAGAFKRLGKTLQNNLKAPDVKAFFDYIAKAAPRAFENWGKILGNFTMGLLNMFRAFDPLAKSMEQGFLNMSSSFREWADQLGKSKKFQQFIKYTKENGPKLLSIFGNIVKGLVGMFSAFAPLSADMLTGLQKLTEKFQIWGETLSQNKQFQSFIAYVRKNGPVMLDVLGRLVKFIGHILTGMGFWGEKILKVVDGFLQWSNSMMKANPIIEKIIGGISILIGSFMAITPAIIAFRTLFSGAFSFVWRLFMPFKVGIVNGMKLLGRYAGSVAKTYGKHLGKIGKGFMWLVGKIGGFIGRIAFMLGEFVLTMAKTVGKVLMWAGRLAKGFLIHAARFAAGWVVAMGPVGWVIAAVVALVALIIWKWDEVKKWTVKIWKSVTSWLSKTWDTVSSKASQFLTKIVNYVRDKFSRAKQRAVTLATNMKDNILDIFRNIREGISNKMQEAKEAISDKIKSALDFVTGMGSSFLDAGKGLIEQMAKGIENAAGKVISKVKNLASEVRDFLPFSPAKTGPLKDIGKLNFGGPIAGSIQKALPKVKRAMANMLALPEMQMPQMASINTPSSYGGSLDGAVSSSNTTNKTENNTPVTINIYDAEDDTIAEIKRFFNNFEREVTSS